MSGFITADGADYLLSVFSASTSVASAYYVALITGNPPGVAISGSELDEPLAEDYYRATIDNISGSWSVFAGTLSSAVDIVFPMTVTDWGTVAHWALCDQQYGGKVLYAGSIDPFITVVGEEVFLPAGALSISMELSGWKSVD